jgi:hypothetical protein
VVSRPDSSVPSSLTALAGHTLENPTGLSRVKYKPHMKCPEGSERHEALSDTGTLGKTSGMHDRQRPKVIDTPFLSSDGVRWQVLPKDSCAEYVWFPYA